VPAIVLRKYIRFGAQENAYARIAIEWAPPMLKIHSRSWNSCTQEFPRSRSRSGRSSYIQNTLHSADAIRLGQSNSELRLLCIGMAGFDRNSIMHPLPFIPGITNWMLPKMLIFQDSYYFLPIQTWIFV